MSPAELMSKASRALDSAGLLLVAGDVDGACNRVYYSMFDAARAALMASGAPVEAVTARTHSGVIAAFGMHIVKQGLALIEHGRAFNRLHELRMIADYRGDSVDAALVRQAIADGEAFLAAMDQLISAQS